MDLIVMCIGNRDGGDDAVGPYIADKLKDTNINVIDCGVIPENYTYNVRRSNPDLVLIVDAVDMNLNPGEIRIIPKEKIGVMHISTHGIPVSVLIGYLEKSIDNVIFIGIQPAKMFGKMSEIVKLSADKLVEMNVASANNLTVPLNSSVAFPTGTQILLAQYGAGQTTVVATSGVTIRSNGGKLKLNVQYSGATLIKIGTDEWYLFGDIVA